mgnify:CR=1 FL=1
MKLIIQIPCLNEAETLEIALNDLPKTLDGIDEIVFLIIKMFAKARELSEKALAKKEEVVEEKEVKSNSKKETNKDSDKE